MPVSQVGLVYYADDPERAIFRRVMPEVDDLELDDPVWVTLGCDPSRQAVLVKVDKDSVLASSPLTGTP